MISISTTTANENGNVVFKELPSSKLQEKEARVSRSATLDGGVYVNHSGFVNGDRTLVIRANLSRAAAARLTSVFELYTDILISMSDGIYLGVISKLSILYGALRMTVLLEQKEN